MNARKGAYVLEGMLVVAALLAATGIVLPVATRMRNEADRKACLENLRIIGQAVQEWSKRHDYALPPGKGMSGYCNSLDGKPLPGNLYAVEPGLNALWDKGNGVIQDVNVFRCPADRRLEPPPAKGEDFTSPGQLSYAMTGRLYPTDAANKVIVADKSDKNDPDRLNIPSANHDHHFINVLFFDGHVRTVLSPVLPAGAGSDSGSIYAMETGDQNDTYIE